nr:hypothetical protein [Streptomyces noursei]
MITAAMGVADDGEDGGDQAGQPLPGVVAADLPAAGDRQQQGLERDRGLTQEQQHDLGAADEEDNQSHQHHRARVRSRGQEHGHHALRRVVVGEADVHDGLGQLVACHQQGVDHGDADRVHHDVDQESLEDLEKRLALPLDDHPHALKHRQQDRDQGADPQHDRVQGERGPGPFFLGVAENAGVLDPDAGGHQPPRHPGLTMSPVNLAMSSAIGLRRARRALNHLLADFRCRLVKELLAAGSGADELSWGKGTATLAQATDHGSHPALRIVTWPTVALAAFVASAEGAHNPSTTSSAAITAPSRARGRADTVSTSAGPLPESPSSR